MTNLLRRLNTWLVLQKRLNNWQTINLASSALALGFVLSGAASPTRVVVVLWFLLVCPGMALVSHLALPSRADQLALAIAVSLAIDTAVSMVFMYLHAWTPTTCVSVLAIATVLVSWWPFRSVEAGGRS